MTGSEGGGGGAQVAVTLDSAKDTDIEATIRPLGFDVSPYEVHPTVDRGPHRFGMLFGRTRMSRYTHALC